MFKDLKEIMDKASSKGDMAVVLIAGTTGFIIDAGLNLVGFLEPGVVGLTFASGALGVKKGIEAMTEKTKGKNESDKKQKEQNSDTRNKIDNLKKLLDKSNSIYLIDSLEKDYELYNSGLLSIDEINSTINRIVEKIRTDSK